MPELLLQGEPEAVDVLFDGFEIHEIRARFVETENLHGAFYLVFFNNWQLLQLNGMLSA